MASLLYGAGLWLAACARMRAKDVDVERLEIVMRDGKGRKDADGTVVELLAWFHRDAGAWAKWKAARTRFDTFLDVRAAIPLPLPRRTPWARTWRSTTAGTPSDP